MFHPHRAHAVDSVDKTSTSNSLPKLMALGKTNGTQAAGLARSTGIARPPSRRTLVASDVVFLNSGNL